ncbi:MAG TPA: hypothetical protein VN636_02580 [Acidimicrobiia bacterium]|nr:hypothetical protein [Acidimicrobiia bacterium]
MSQDLAPLRHAHDLLQDNQTVDEIIAQLQVLYDLDFVDAMASVAASVLLLERGLTVPQEPLVRPYVTRGPAGPNFA